MIEMASPELKPGPMKLGPTIKPGFIVAISNYSSLGSPFWKSQAAYSARVLLFA